MQIVIYVTIKNAMHCSILEKKAANHTSYVLNFDRSLCYIIHAKAKSQLKGDVLSKGRISRQKQTAYPYFEDLM